MKQRIQRLSVHQNAKVAGVLMAVSSLVFIVPFALIARSFGPAQSGPSAALLLFLPVIYLILGYLGTAVACAFYNFMVRFIGGIEYESTAAD